jgi:hypothetical protein
VSFTSGNLTYITYTFRTKTSLNFAVYTVINMLIIDKRKNIYTKVIKVLGGGDKKNCTELQIYLIKTMPKVINLTLSKASNKSPLFP